MAYDTKDLERKAIKAIDKYKLLFLEDVIAYLPCSSATFYNHKMEELESIKKGLESNRINIKVGLRSKWYKGNNPTTQLALYKLSANEEELKRLNTQNVDHGASKGTKVVLKVSNELKDDMEKLD